MTESRHPGPKGVVTLILFVLMLAYPFLVYMHIEAVSPRWYGAVLLVAVTLRFLYMGNVKQFSDWLMMLVATVFCVFIMLFESTLLVKFYPVLMNIGMGMMFIVSLSGSETLIEKFAKAGGKTPPEQARGYLRALSLSWGVLLLLNGAISAYTVWFSSLSTWAVYNGFISYLVIAGFAVAEFGYRRYYKKRHNIVDD